MEDKNKKNKNIRPSTAPDRPESPTLRKDRSKEGQSSKKKVR